MVLWFCEPECPLDAIKAYSDTGMERWLAVNALYAKQWPNIMVKRDAPPDAKAWEDIADKFEKHFSANPGTGD